MESQNATEKRNIDGPRRPNNTNPSKFRVIAAIYREKIIGGAPGFEPGDSMPSRREMADKHHTTRPTIDKAMELLTAEGLLQFNGNQRSIITDRLAFVPSMEDRMASLRSTGKILGKGETCEILECSTVPCPPNIAQHLQVEPGSDVLKRVRRTRRHGKPIAVSESYFPPFAVEAAPEIGEPENIEGGAREAAVHALEVTQDEALEYHTSHMADEREKELLEVTAKYVSILQTLRVVKLSDGRVVEVAVKCGDGKLPVATRVNLRPAEQPV